MRRPSLLVLVAFAALAIGIWLVVRGPDTDRSTAGLPSHEPAQETEPSPLILRGRANAADPTERWWLTVTVVDDEVSAPVADTPFTFLLRLAEVPKLVVPIERTTDADGRVRIGPILAPFAKAKLEVAARSDRYAVAMDWACAEPHPSEERALRATCQVVRISIVTGRVALPPGVPSDGVVVWREIGPHFWVPVEIDPSGLFTHQGYGAGPIVLEAAAAWQGTRWYGRAKVEEGTRDVVLTLSDVRPGDPALLRVHLVGPDGAAATGLVNMTIDSPTGRSGGTRHRHIAGTRMLGFLYEPFATIEIDVEGIAPPGLGKATVGGIGMDRTEVTVRLPSAPQTPQVGAPRVAPSWLSEETRRPRPPGPSSPALVVRVQDWDFEDRGTWVCLVRDRSIIAHARLDAEGVARLRAVPDLTDHQIWVAALGGNRYVWAKDLDAAADSIEVRPQVGGTVCGTVRFAVGTTCEEWFVFATGPALSSSILFLVVGVFDVTYGNEAFVVHGVPPGTWEFSLWHLVDGEYEWVDFEARAGEHVVVDVKAE